MHSNKIKCPDCGAPLVLKRSHLGKLYLGCVKYPVCSGYHSVHQRGKLRGVPLGVPANAETRQWRKKAHEVFDKLWNGDEPFMSKEEAYEMMGLLLNKPVKECHISLFDTEMCQKVIEVSKRHVEFLEGQREDNRRLFELGLIKDYK